MTTFSLSEDSKGKSLAIFFDNGDSETIPESHVSFKAILEHWLSGTVVDEEIRELVDVLNTVARKMASLSERVSVDGKDVYFDGDPLRGELMDVIKSLFEQGRALDFKPLVNFLEKAKTNPSLKSVDDLYRWIKNGDLVIDPDGDIIAYKAVEINSEGVSVSIHSGKAFVNGEEVEGQIPNVPGTVISMARSEVDDNQGVACSTGLHAGTHKYTQWFGGSGNGNRTILVKINPRDVVSVPNDSSAQKLRVSRYVVLSEIVEKRLDTHVFNSGVSDSPDEDEDYDEEEEDYYYDDEEEYEDDYEEEEEEAPVADSYRDQYGRFIKGTSAPRDSKGRFLKGI